MIRIASFCRTVLKWNACSASKYRHFACRNTKGSKNVLRGSIITSTLKSSSLEKKKISNVGQVWIVSCQEMKYLVEMKYLFISLYAIRHYLFDRSISIHFSININHGTHRIILTQRSFDVQAVLEIVNVTSLAVHSAH